MEEIKTYHSNGNLFIHCQMEHGQYNGFYREYYNSGQLLRSSSCKNGLFHGVYIEFYESGNIAKITLFNIGLTIQSDFYQDDNSPLLLLRQQQFLNEIQDTFNNNFNKFFDAFIDQEEILDLNFDIRFDLKQNRAIGERAPIC